MAPTQTQQAHHLFQARPGRRSPTTREILSHRMKTLLALCCATHCIASAVPISCPASPPASWGMPTARLESVKILGIPGNHPSYDTAAPPILAPDEETSTRSHIRQFWRVWPGKDGYRFYLDCGYTRTDRLLRLQLTDQRSCIALDKLKTRTFHVHCE
jgi:hypothetical protein